MSQLFASPKEFFAERIAQAISHRKMSTTPQAQGYLVDLLMHYIFTQNLFAVEHETGRLRRETLAELYLKAGNAPPAQQFDLLKKLGDTSLYISGFFGDSLNRQLVDLDYYVEMGGTAYLSLSSATVDESASQVFAEMGKRFVEFVDVLTFMSQESRVQTNEDLLRLYDRYITTGSKLAEEQLLEKGVLNIELDRVRAFKQ